MINKFFFCCLLLFKNFIHLLFLDIYLQVLLFLIFYFYFLLFLNVITGENSPQLHSARKEDAHRLAIRALVNRMKYYPVVQTICRFGAIWDEYDNYRYSSFASRIMAAICGPSTGACYFFVFLVRSDDFFICLTTL